MPLPLPFHTLPFSSPIHDSQQLCKNLQLSSIYRPHPTKNIQPFTKNLWTSHFSPLSSPDHLFALISHKYLFQSHWAPTSQPTPTSFTTTTMTNPILLLLPSPQEQTPHQQWLPSPLPIPITHQNSQHRQWYPFWPPSSPSPTPPSAPKPHHTTPNPNRISPNANANPNANHPCLHAALPPQHHHTNPKIMLGTFSIQSDRNSQHQPNSLPSQLQCSLWHPQLNHLSQPFPATFVLPSAIITTTPQSPNDNPHSLYPLHYHHHPHHNRTTGPYQYGPHTPPHLTHDNNHSSASHTDDTNSISSSSTSLTQPSLSIVFLVLRLDKCLPLFQFPCIPGLPKFGLMAVLSCLPFPYLWKVLYMVYTSRMRVFTRSSMPSNGVWAISSHKPPWHSPTSISPLGVLLEDGVLPRLISGFQSPMTHISPPLVFPTTEFPYRGLSIGFFTCWYIGALL